MDVTTFSHFFFRLVREFVLLLLKSSSSFLEKKKSYEWLSACLVGQLSEEEILFDFSHGSVNKYFFLFYFFFLPGNSRRYYILYLHI